MSEIGPALTFNRTETTGFFRTAWMLVSFYWFSITAFLSWRRLVKEAIRDGFTLDQFSKAMHTAATNVAKDTDMYVDNTPAGGAFKMNRRTHGRKI